MDKKLRNLLILGGLLILLCAGYAVAGLVFKEDIPEDETTAETTAEEASFLSVTEDGLTALTYTYDADGDGVAETWSYTRSADGETWHWADDPAVPLGSSAFYGYSSTLYGIKVISTLTEVTEAELAEYGLDQPLKTVTFTDKVGGTQGFCIGAYNTYNGTYCAYKQGDPSTVYLLDGEFYADFEMGVTSLVYYDDLPAFAAEGLVSLTLTDGERTVAVTRTAPVDSSAQAVWYRSVNGASPVAIAADLGKSLELLVGDMDYLVCYSVKASDFAAYGLDQNTTLMTVTYTKTVSSVTEEFTFKLTLGSTDKYGYYYANPEGTTLTMLLGGSVFSKVMTYDDEHLAAGDPTPETDTAA
jgi:hypothetical protein